MIVIGVFCPLALLVADVAAGTPRQFRDIAYTLGATRSQAFVRVFLRASLPGVVDLMRVSFGWAWTYVIGAELVAASKGVGYVILSASRYQSTDQIMAGVLTIGGGRPAMSAITVRNVTKDFIHGRRSARALEGIDLAIADGTFTCLVGASGCGKSTLLNIIAGLLSPTSGSVLVNDRPVEGPGPDRGPRRAASRRRSATRSPPVCWTRWAWPSSPPPIRANCPAEWRSARPSRGRSPTSPTSC